MNQEKHWNRIGTKYSQEIFDVFASDKEQKLSAYFKKHASMKHSAIDFGCGTGKAFRYMSPSFSRVLAIDISSELLDQASRNAYKNITYKQADLTSDNLVFPPTDFVFCCNVLLLPEADKDFAMMKNIYKALRIDGVSLVIVPSLESVLFSSWRLVDWYKKEGVTAAEIPADELAYYKPGVRSLVQGVVQIDKVPTKHYSAPELQILFSRAGLKITALEKLEYHWNTEFDSPPAWMKAPYPWDWLIECKKEK